MPPMQKTRYIRPLMLFRHQGVTFEPGQTYALKGGGALVDYFCHPDLKWAEEVKPTPDPGAIIVGGLSLPARVLFGDGARRGHPVFS